MIGYFEGIEAERGIAWRLKDSSILRRFVSIALDEDTPDHSTISRTRRPTAHARFDKTPPKPNRHAVSLLSVLL